jgi:hypothetical protein
MNTAPTKMRIRSIRVKKYDIGYIRWLLESHDGMATPTTREGTSDVLDILIAPDFFDEFDEFLQALSHELELEPVPTPDILPLEG